MAMSHRLLALTLLPVCWSYVTKQSHVFNDLGGELAADGNVSTCMSTGINRWAWWMRTWDNPVTFNTVQLHGKTLFICTMTN